MRLLSMVVLALLLLVAAERVRADWWLPYEAHLPVVVVAPTPTATPVPTATPIPTPTPRCPSAIVNDKFQEGLTGWAVRAGNPLTSQGVLMLGIIRDRTDAISQPVRVPEGAERLEVYFWWSWLLSEASLRPYDFFQVDVRDGEGHVLAQRTFSNATSSKEAGPARFAVEVGDRGGQTLELWAWASNDRTYVTTWLVSPIRASFDCVP